MKVKDVFKESGGTENFLMKYKFIVIDKVTCKIVWTEVHDSCDSMKKAMEWTKENTFNPDYFSYEVIFMKGMNDNENSNR